MLRLHGIGKYTVEEDIKKYLRETLEFVPPPSDEQIEQHVGKLFTYAAILCGTPDPVTYLWITAPDSESKYTGAAQGDMPY